MRRQIFNQPDLKRLKNQYIYYLLPVASLLIAVASFALMAPKFLTIFTIREDIKAKEVAVTEMQQKLQELQGVDFKKVEEEVSLAELVIPSEKKVTEAFLNIDTLAGEEQILVEEIKVAPGAMATESAGVEGIVFNMSLTGQLENLEKFLGRLGRAAPVVAVNSLEMNLEEGLWETNLDFSVFYSNEALRFKASSPLPQLSGRGEEMRGKLGEFEAFYLGEVGEELLEIVPFSPDRDVFSLP